MVQRIDTILVFCDVPENDVPHLQIGGPAIVKPYGFEGKPFVGSVTRFSLRLNPETRNMRTVHRIPAALLLRNHSEETDWAKPLDRARFLSDGRGMLRLGVTRRSERLSVTAARPAQTLSA